VAAGGLTAFTRNTKSACAPACPSSMCVYTIACSEHVSIEQMFFLPSPCEDTDKTRDSRLQLYGAVHITTHTRLISNVVSATVSASPAGVPVGLGGARGVRERDTRADGARVVVLRRQRHRETSRPRDPRRAAREDSARAQPPQKRVCETWTDRARSGGAHRGDSLILCVCGGESGDLTHST
jgi:hypothetical protein